MTDAEHIEALHDEIAKRCRASRSMPDVEFYTRCVAALIKLKDALKDVERYRWLRDEYAGSLYLQDQFRTCNDGDGYYDVMFYGISDAEIDKARATKPEGDQ